MCYAAFYRLPLSVPPSVIPAQAGIHAVGPRPARWTPACAGVTEQEAVARNVRCKVT